MSVDIETVRRVARLARIAVTEDEAATMRGELNTILAWVEQLNEVDVAGVEPMTAVIETAMKKRDDAVTTGDIADVITGNAPRADGPFFAVPKVVE